MIGSILRIVRAFLGTVRVMLALVGLVLFVTACEIAVLHHIELGERLEGAVVALLAVSLAISVWDSLDAAADRIVGTKNGGWKGHFHLKR